MNTKYCEEETIPSSPAENLTESIRCCGSRNIFTTNKVISIENDEIPQIYHHASHAFVSPPFTWMFKIIVHRFQVSTTFIGQFVWKKITRFCLFDELTC